jgi:hypothetical protein
MKWIIPSDSERVIAVGHTGSGKSQMLTYLLSLKNLQARPWIIIDYKRDPLFQSMLKQRIIRHQLKPVGAVPKRAGLYLMRPLELDADDVNTFLWRVHRRGRIGLLFDECAWAPAGEGSAVRAILQQGRSLRIPVLAGNQRPVSMGDRNFIEQADYISVFWLSNREDRKIIAQYAPIDPDIRLEQYHSWWYDVKRDKLFRLTPVPPGHTILSMIAEKTPKNLWWR